MNKDEILQELKTSINVLSNMSQSNYNQELIIKVGQAISKAIHYIEEKPDSINQEMNDI